MNRFMLATIEKNENPKNLKISGIMLSFYIKCKDRYYFQYHKMIE